MRSLELKTKTEKDLIEEYEQAFERYQTISERASYVYSFFEKNSMPMIRSYGYSVSTVDTERQNVPEETQKDLIDFGWNIVFVKDSK